jgi:protein-tyrosine kinase
LTEDKAKGGRSSGSALSSSVEKAAERLARAAGTAPPPGAAARPKSRSSIERSLAVAPGDAPPAVPAPPALIAPDDPVEPVLPVGPAAPPAAPASIEEAGRAIARRIGEPARTPSAPPPSPSPPAPPPAADAPPAPPAEAPAAEAPPEPEASPAPTAASPDTPSETEEGHTLRGVREAVKRFQEPERAPVDLDAIRQRFAEPEEADGDRVVLPPAPPPPPEPKPAAQPPARRGRADRKGRAAPPPPAGAADAPPRRRRGPFGLLWAIVRFLLIGSKKKRPPPREAAPRAKTRRLPLPRFMKFPKLPAVRLPAKLVAKLPKLPAPLARFVSRLQRILGRSKLFARLPLPSRIRALSLKRGIAENVAMLRGGGTEGEPTEHEKALEAARLRFAAADTHMRRPLDLKTRMGRTVEIDLEAVHAAGMVTPFGERTQIAEEFRLIKRPILLNAFEKGADAIRNGNVIMVNSSRSGEGKTFTAINLAMSIATERDLTVLLIDADVAKPDIPNALGFEADLGLVDLIADDRIRVSDVILRTNIDNLSIMPAGRPHHLATELLASERMAQLVSELSLRYPERVVVMDSPPALLSSVAGVLALNVGQILFVIEAERTSQSAVDNAIGLVSACKNINLLLNKSRPLGGSDRFGSYYTGYY